MKLTHCIIASVVGLMSTSALAQKVFVKMDDLNTGQHVGYVEVTQTPVGVVFTPNIKVSNVRAGLHGFHVHQNPSCGPSYKDGKKIIGGAAGGHYDPFNTKKHGFPWTEGNHLGDLPAIYFNEQGLATSPVLSPRLTLAELKSRSLMIHIGGDNYSDHPKPLGGGGMRMICGVFQAAKF